MDLKNKKLLVIVESPAKSKHISEYLKAAGYTKATVVASVGHISNLKDARSSYRNTGIYPEDNFRMNIAITDDKKEVVYNLKEKVKAAEYVYLMTDGDREGEAIAWSLVEFLKLKPGTYFRAITHEITPKAVIAAIENPIQLNYNLIEAAHSRMAVDKMVGYSLSPIAKAYIGARSVGRCQSAGLKLIVDKEKEIQNFIPEIYYDLYLNFSKNKTNFKAKYIGTDKEAIQHLKTEAEVKVIKFKCNGDYVIRDIITKEKQESPKPPFTTATFQQEASSKIGLKVKDAMSLAQRLFESGRITYHRVDSTEMSPEFIEILKNYVEQNFGTFIQPRKGKTTGNEQNGHECLRVTDPALTPEEFIKVESNALLVKVYTLIWQRTVASVLPNARISETIYNIYNNDQKFTLVSREIIDEGYRKIYKYNEDNKDDLVKETFSVNEVLQNCELEDQKKMTSPPPRYSEASLVAELKDRGIGRPSTYSSIVETVLSTARGYAKLEDKKIVPTDKGIQLSNFLDRSFSGIINLNYTRDMEECLDDIANGDLTRVDFLQTVHNNIEEAIKNNKENCSEMDDTKTCPNCGGKMVIRRSRFGKLFYGCASYPECHGIINID